MQQTSDTPFSSISCIPDEILLMILRRTMRSDVPVYSEHFLKLGRQLQDIRNANDTESLGTDSSKVEPRLSKLSASASSESWFLKKLDPSQIEHYRDWLTINSTCRRFRARGKQAFFADKTFIFQPRFFQALFGKTTTKTINAKNIREGQGFIRDVIAPLSQSCASEIIILLRYKALQSLRSLSIQIVRGDFEIFSMLNAPPLQRDPLPEELSTLLRANGFPVDRLQVDLQLDKEDPIQMIVLKAGGYSALGAFAETKRK